MEEVAGLPGEALLLLVQDCFPEAAADAGGEALASHTLLHLGIAQASLALRSTCAKAGAGIVVFTFGDVTASRQSKQACSALDLRNVGVVMGGLLHASVCFYGAKIRNVSNMGI